MKYLAICFCGLIGVAGCGTTTTGEEAGRILPQEGVTTVSGIPTWVAQQCSDCEDEDILDLLEIVNSQRNDGWTYNDMTADALLNCENMGDECTSALLSCHMDVIDYMQR